MSMKLAQISLHFTRCATWLPRLHSRLFLVATSNFCQQTRVARDFFQRYLICQPFSTNKLLHIAHASSTLASQPQLTTDNTSTMPSTNPHGGATNERTMEQRVRQLEMKLEEQQAANAGLRDDMKDLKELVNGDRQESKESFSHHDAKKKKLFALLEDVNKSVAKLQDEQKSMASKAELHTLSRQLDDLRYKLFKPPLDLAELILL